jgi:hypothetical protein
MVNHNTTEPCNLSNVVLKSALNNKPGLKFGYFNARSILHKMDQVKQLFDSVAFDVICVSETWLKDHIYDASVSLGGFNLFRNDRTTTKSGGICIYVRRGLQCKVIYKSTTDCLEILLVEVVTNSCKLLVVLVYKPPSKPFVGELDHILGQFSSMYNDIVICGDFNCNLFKNSSNTKNLTDLLISHSLAICNNEPTYFYADSASLLDLIITNNKQKIKFFNQISVGFLDHDVLFWTYDISLCRSQETWFRDYKNINMFNLLSECASLRWDDLFNYSDINHQLYLFNDMVVYLYEKYVPLRSFKPKVRKPPWLTVEILNLITLREFAFIKWKNERTLDNRQIYKELRNKITAMIRKEKSVYLDNLFDSDLSQQEFWGLINRIGCSKKNRASNCQFSAYEFSKEFNNPLGITQIPNYNHQIEQMNPTSQTSKLSFTCIDFQTLDKALKSIKSESIGLDLIPIKFIKLISPIVLKYILFIINNVITYSCFPDAWKQSKLIPIPKNRTPSTLSDYRPISILPSLSKVIEKILKEQITEHLNKFGLLDQYQSAYRVAHSTSSAVLNIVDDIRRSADSNKATILVLLDFTKAFDSINHHILINKLQRNFQFSRTACSLIHSYLSNRKYCVQCGETFSDVFTNSCGVPQGSVLGPLLFSLYINDLPKVLRDCNYHLFADDVQIYTACSPNEINAGILNINSNIIEIEDWATHNGLVLNPKKTQSIVIYKHKLNTRHFPPISVCNENIPFVDCVNDLGVLINNCLSWDEHINMICCKTYMKLRTLWSVTDFASNKLRRKLFLSYVFPYFSYGEMVLFGMHEYNMDKLNKAFKAGVRYIYRLRKYDHISLVIPKVIGCSLNDYYTFRICLSIYKVLDTRMPLYLYMRFEKSNLLRNNILKLPKNKTRLLNSSFFVKGVGCWNSLPSSVKLAASHAGFIKLYFATL